MNDADFGKAKQSNTIPVIDISSVIDGKEIKETATAIYKAATQHGFFYLTGHGIDPRVLEQAFSVSKDFFAQPERDKNTIAVNTQQRGWMAQGMSQLPGAKTHDLKEVFFWGPELSADDPDILANKPLMALNQWPNTTFPRLQQELLPYYNALCEVANSVMSALAVRLDQPLDFFVSCYKKPMARGQLVYYPPATQSDEADERYGVAPHTDFGVLTLLLQDNSGGLQILSNSGDWIEAPPIEGTLVCNIGDLLARWSNNRFTSTVHRVVNKTRFARYSIPIFFDPHTDTIIDPVDLGVSKENSKFEPVTAGEHIVARNKKSFSHYKP